MECRICIQYLEQNHNTRTPSTYYQRKFHAISQPGQPWPKNFSWPRFFMRNMPKCINKQSDEEQFWILIPQNLSPKLLQCCFSNQWPFSSGLDSYSSTQESKSQNPKFLTFYNYCNLLGKFVQKIQIEARLSEKNATGLGRHVLLSTLDI